MIQVRQGAHSKQDAPAARQQPRSGALWRLPAGFFPVFIIASLFAWPVHAQSPDCDRIRSQIAYIDQNGGASGGSSRAGQYASAAQRQQAELDRTSSYARSLGCDRSGFSFFGNSQPVSPQCNGLNARIQAMQANLGKLQSMAGGTGSRSDLVARYNAYCRNQPRGFFDSLFGTGGGTQSDVPLDTPPEDDQTPRGGSQAICVRRCDGGFFPLNYSARTGNLDTLGELCTALCPNAEVSLYTRNPDNDVGTAVGADGTAYRDLQNAFKFQKTFDSSCTCKAKGESWVQALSQSDAERVLGQERKGDIIVTPEKSLELSRPKMDPLLRAKLLAADPTPFVPARSPAAQAVAPAANSPAPSFTPTNAAAADQAGTQEVTGPDGVKRRVRIVGPTP
jgi:Protein of unknown function (DUF2865)